MEKTIPRTCISPEGARMPLRELHLGRMFPHMLYPHLLAAPLHHRMRFWKSCRAHSFRVGHAISSTSPEAAYYNLGAFSQSVRLGLTHSTLQYQRVLFRLNSWLSMLFPLGTWSSICISHNELLRLHRDSTNEPNTLNYTVTLGPFTGGGLYCWSPRPASIAISLKN